MSQIPNCSYADWLENKVATDREAAGIILPPSWREERLPPSDPLFGLRMYRKGGLIVLFSADHTSFDKPWLHVSFSRKGKVPSYEDMVEVKTVFVGVTRQAIQVLPPKAKHINIHPNCLHLWCCLAPEGDGLPDFGKFGMI